MSPKKHVPAKPMVHKLTVVGSGSDGVVSLPPAKQTLLECLFQYPHMFSDDEMKVWVSTRLDGLSNEYGMALMEVMNQPGVLPPYHELVVADPEIPLVPGQPFILLRVGDHGYTTMNTAVVSRKMPFFKFRGVTFYVHGDWFQYGGMPIGDRRLYKTAGRRAAKAAGGNDWFGGIATFARDYLRRPRGWKAPSPGDQQPSTEI